MFGTEGVLVVPKTSLGHLWHRGAQIASPYRDLARRWPVGPGRVGRGARSVRSLGPVVSFRRPARARRALGRHRFALEVVTP